MTDVEPSERPAKQPASKRLVSWLVALGAISAMVWVVYRNGGVATVRDVIERLDTTWPLLFIPYFINATLAITAYRTALPGRGQVVPWFPLVQVERSGSALNAILPLGDSSSNVLKVALLRHWFTSPEIVAAGAWGALGTGIGNMVAGVFALVGSFVFPEIPTGWAALIALASIVIGIPACTVLVLARKGVAARVAAFLARVPFEFVRARREAILAWAQRLDVQLAAATGARKRDFVLVVAFKLLYQIVHILEIWLVIDLLDLPGGLGAALVYNAMERSVRQVFAFVPGGFGIVEGSSALLGPAMGLPANFSVQLSLALRFTYVVNLFLAGSALSSVHALSLKYPARTAEVILAERAQKELEGR